jgi:SAM-dependent methyltransferase
VDLNVLIEILTCPTCGGKVDLLKGENSLACQNCLTRYEVYDDRIPVLLNERSRKDIESFYQNRIPVPGQGKKKKTKRFFTQAPDLELNHKREKNLLRCINLLSEEQPRILTIGNFMPYREKTNDLAAEVRRKYAATLKMDILVRDNIDLVGDGHVLPLVDNYFDIVIAQATMKHLRDPGKFVREVYRVLRPQGIFYCEIAYLLPYHRWPGDYVRFTPLGYKELLKNFDIVDSNYIRGPSQTIADIVSIYLAMLLSFRNKLLYSIIIKSVSWVIHPLKYIDLFLWKNPWSDLLSQVNYCIAQKSETSKNEI